MQDIETERLLLHVKSFEEMKQGMLSGDEMSMDFYHAYKYHKENAPGYDLEWFRLWDFYLKDSNTIIGGACFKGQPNEKGEVEIGYGIDDEYQNLGYATEAIGALIDMTKQDIGVKKVLFEIEQDNFSSLRVAQKLNAEFIRVSDHMKWYGITVHGVNGDCPQ